MMKLGISNIGWIVSAVHSLNRQSIENLKVGDRFEETVLVTESLVKKFIDLSDDFAPVHVNGDHAKTMGYAAPIAHGLLIVSRFSRILGMYLPGSNTILHQVSSQMKAPVYMGDQLLYTVTVARLIPAVKAVQLSLKVVNQEGILVNNGEATCLFRI